jgi:hypothetical protein
VTHAGARGRRPDVACVRELDRARLGRVLSDVSLALQGFEMRVHRRRRRQTDGISDLTNARRVAALLDGAKDVIEDLLLTRAERGHTTGGRSRAPGHP